MSELAEMILALDRKQSLDDGRRCRVPDHGKLWAHKSGAVLVCGKCDYYEPASVLNEDEAQAMNRQRK